MKIIFFESRNKKWKYNNFAGAQKYSTNNKIDYNLSI